MKRKTNRIKIAGFLSLAIFCLAFNFSISSAAQENNAVVNPTPTPHLKSTPKPPTAATPLYKPGCETTNSGCPPFGKVTTGTPTPAPTPPQYKSVSEVVAKIQNVLTRGELQRGQVGIKIVSLDTGKIIYQENAEKYFMPASNMKSYTMAAAMEKLSPDFRFATSVYAPAMPDATGTIRGDLTIFGRGDISISSSFNDGDYYKGLDALATKIAQAGVKRIEGNLVGDESYFVGSPIPYGWEWDDLQWTSGAEISALSVNNNTLRLNVKPGGLNSPCVVQFQPTNAIYKTLNQCVTTNANAKRNLEITKKLDLNVLEVSGTLPAGDKGFEGFVTVSRPAQLFVEMLRGLLIQKGVVITGQNRVVNGKEKNYLSNPPGFEIAKLESPPFSEIAAKTMKPSQNLYAETILWTLGEQIGRKQELVTAEGKNAPEKISGEDSIKKLEQTPSAELGVKVVQDFLKEIGIAPDSVIEWDGSGLSRHNLVTPASAVQLFTYMARSRYANVWRDSLTIGAVDGTLQNRFKGTSAAGNVRGKTGTIDQVSALSGYVTNAAGEKLVFSIIVNGVNDAKIRQAAIDDIVVALSNFNGRTN